MVYLYGSQPGRDPKLVATFDSEPQLLAYVRWATLQENPFKFEQGSVLVGSASYSYSQLPVDEGPADAELPHNPSPSML